MDLLQILGFFGAFLIGVILGLIGGGGSILTVPILVYLFPISPVIATAYSLFAVGVASLVGAIKNMQKGLVNIPTAVVFSIPALTAVYVTRKFVLPAIPEQLFSIADFQLTKNVGIMLFFAFIMILAAVSMIKKQKYKIDRGQPEKMNYVLITIEGLVIGFLTGIVGAGGGFLIIPALVLLAKLPMKTAVGTSLLIIAVKSLTGFIGDVQNIEIEWTFLIIFSSLSIVGMYLGIFLNRYINGKKLRKSFGWFVLVMAVFIMYKEITSNSF